ncbi:MAG: FRG domain-containing protein, partial [Actinobacteria bacterium]|nr:FRG domain-containing protein [Actinomycetota bacterium]
MEEVRVESFAELHERLFEGSWNAAIGRFRSDLAFRGLGDAQHGLATSLTRLGDGYEDLEAHLLRNFRKYARRDAVPVDTEWDWLALAKHHGLPTRVLDWSYSPYVALHFATEDHLAFDRDGVVWAIDYVRAHDELPPALRELLDREGSNVFTGEMLGGVAPRLAELQALADEPFLVFFEPPSIDERIVNQFALFSLLSSATTGVEEWLERRGGLAQRIVIPAAHKGEVRDKLDQANVTERVLFPGLDGLSRGLARHYP